MKTLLSNLKRFFHVDPPLPLETIKEEPVTKQIIPMLQPPEKIKKKVFVVGEDFLIEKMFKDRGWDTTKDVFKADLFCFTGGPDVSPELYGQENVHSFVSKGRDDVEKRLYDRLLNSKAPMVGICRGGQFLNVMNGGTMWQHVDGHALHGLHKMYIVDGDEETSVEECPEMYVTSTHHQMMRPDIDGEVIAVAMESSSKEDDQGVVKKGDKTFNEVDIEIVYYPETSSLCFQPHPEYAYCPRACTDYFFELLETKLDV